MAAAGNYPLVFTYSEIIAGSGFAALVEVRGRAVLTVEEDRDHWIYGVQPGAVAGGGRDWGQAVQAFKKNYLSVLYDIANEAASYEAFAEEVQRYFDARNDPTKRDWDEALKAVRDGSASFEGLTRVSADKHPVGLRIRRLEQQTLKPDLNQFEQVQEAA